MLTSILFYKLILVVVVVLGLSLLAEYLGAKTAGFLSAYPTGTALTMFFYGLEQDATFAAESALYSLAGLLAMQAFLYGYYQAAKAASRFAIAAGIAGAFVAYGITIVPLYYLQPSPLTALIIGAASIVLFIRLFNEELAHSAPRRVRPSLGILLLRTILVIGIFLGITGLAGWVGSAWAGLLAAFPVTVFPLILIIHASHDKTAALNLIAQVPRGLGSILAYSGTVFLLFPHAGIYWGTLWAFAAATGYILIYRLLAKSSEAK